MQGIVNKCISFFELSIFLSLSKSVGEIFVYRPNTSLNRRYFDLAFSSIVVKFKYCRINCVIREKNIEATKDKRLQLQKIDS
jgi:hypothetical protein